MIGLREDQRVKEGLVTFLNNATGQCGRGLAPDSGGSDKQMQADTQSSGASPFPHWIAVSFRPEAGSAASKDAG